MSEQRYEYCDDIAAIVDMAMDTGEGGEELTDNDVVERLNQLEREYEGGINNAKLLNNELMRQDTEIAALKREKEQSKAYIKHHAFCLTWIGKNCNCGLGTLLKAEEQEDDLQR